MILIKLLLQLEFYCPTVAGNCVITCSLGKVAVIACAIAQAVSRWLPTAAAQVRARVWQVGFVVDKVALGQVFPEYFGFPCQSSFHQILHHHDHPGQVQ
jgi:hypothetical protein